MSADRIPNEEHYRALVETTSDWIWETDADARFTYSNRNITDLLGYSPSEILGKRPCDLVQPQDRDRIRELVASLRGASQPFSRMEAVFLAKDGREVVLEVSGVPVFDSSGIFCGRRGIARDITARQRADEAIRQSEEKYRTLVANIPDVVWTIDAQLRFAYISPVIERLSGFKLDDVYRQGARLYLSCLHPDDRARVTEGLRSLFADGRPYDVECRIRRASGEWIWVHDRAYCTYEKDGTRYADGVLSDITNRKRGEEALRKAEEQYRGLFEAINDAVFVVPVRGDLSAARFVAVNEVACQRLGYSREELLSMGPRDLDEPAAFESVVPILPRVLADQQILFETVQVAKDGRKIPVEINARLAQFDGEPAVLAIARDISDRKQAEEALRRSEENYRRLIGNLPDVTWTSDMRGQTTYISPNVEEVFGYTPAEFYERGDELWLGRIHPEDQPQILEAYAALFQKNQRFNVEYRIQRKDGEWIWVYDRSFATHEVNGIVFADGVFSDITRRKQAEQLLRESEERLRSLVECTRDWVWEVDAQGKYTYSSARAKDLLGYEPEEVLGRTPFDFMDPEEARRVAAEFASAVQERRPIQNLENTALHKNGRGVVLETNGLAVFDPNGAFRGYRGIDRDITERRCAERELQRAKDAAEAASRAKSDFLANMSHEIRTPLHGILGMLELVLDSSLSPEQRDHLEIVKSSADSLHMILNDILDFSKIEAGKLDLESVAFNLQDALSPALRALSVTAARKGLQLKYSVASDVPEVVAGDPGRLRQILLNLIGNAIKFTEKGGVTVSIGREASSSGGVWLGFSVADTGIGIPPERREAIFNPFAQADSSTTRRYGGSGLGLSIVRKLTEMMGGRIGFESVVGRGSTFYFSAPFGLASSPVPPAPPPVREDLHPEPDAPPDSPHPACVLVVEDNHVNRLIALRLLERHGFQVELACNGREALEKFRRRCFDAILMDIQMPDMDGFEATAAIREIEKHTGTHVPVIAMTAYAMRGDRDRCLAGGMDSYISKPLRPPELIAEIQRVVLHPHSMV